MAKDLTGKTYGRLTVLHRVENDGKRARWACRCACGNRKVAYATYLLCGDTKSCGCLHVEASTQRIVAVGTKHGGRKDAEYETWRHMNERCYQSSCKLYTNYGGRGIKVHPSWRRSYPTFLADMGRKPTTKHSLDRFPDNDGNYRPGNCRWATAKEQNNNRRSNHLVVFAGRTQTISAWAEELGVSKATIGWRLRNGWAVARALARRGQV